MRKINTGNVPCFYTQIWKRPLLLCHQQWNPQAQVYTAHVPLQIIPRHPPSGWGIGGDSLHGCEMTVVKWVFSLLEVGANMIQYILCM